MQLSNSNCESGSVFRNWQTSTRPAGATSIQGSSACRLLPVILSPNFFEAVENVGAGHGHSSLVIGHSSLVLGRQGGLLLEGIVGGEAGLGGFGLTDSADPVEVAATPYVGEANQEHREECGDIHNGDP